MNVMFVSKLKTEAFPKKYLCLINAFYLTKEFS